MEFKNTLRLCLPTPQPFVFNLVDVVLLPPPPNFSLQFRGGNEWITPMHCESRYFAVVFQIYSHLVFSSGLNLKKGSKAKYKSEQTPPP